MALLPASPRGTGPPCHGQTGYAGVCTGLPLISGRRWAAQSATPSAVSGRQPSTQTPTREVPGPASGQTRPPQSGKFAPEAARQGRPDSRSTESRPHVFTLKNTQVNGLPLRFSKERPRSAEYKKP